MAHVGTWMNISPCKLIIDGPNLPSLAWAHESILLANIGGFKAGKLFSLPLYKVHLILYYQPSWDPNCSTIEQSLVESQIYKQVFLPEYVVVITVWSSIPSPENLAYKLPADVIVQSKPLLHYGVEVDTAVQIVPFCKLELVPASKCSWFPKTNCWY